MVALAYTVIHPGTVMVKSFHTSITYAAVSRPLSSNYLTVRAEENWIKHLQEFLNEIIEQIYQEVGVCGLL